PPPPPDAGTPFSSRENGFAREAEPNLVAVGDTVVAAWIGVRSGGFSTAIGYNVARQGAWQGPRHIDAPSGRLSSDPRVAATRQGDVLLAWVGFGLGPQLTDMHIYLSKLDRVSGQFGTPRPVSDDGTSPNHVFDYPAISIDYDGRVVVTYLDATSPTPAI